MPRERTLIKTIPKIYKRNFENLGLFFWVEAQKKIIPAISIAQAVKGYYDFINEEYDNEISLVNFSRMRSEFIEMGYKRHCDEASEKNK